MKKRIPLYSVINDTKNEGAMYHAPSYEDALKAHQYAYGVKGTPALIDKKRGKYTYVVNGEVYIVFYISSY